MRIGEGPDQDADEIDQCVLECERAPAEVAGPEARGRLAPRELAERVLESSAGSRGVHLREPALELVEGQPSAVVVLAQLVGRGRAVCVRDQRVEALTHGWKPREVLRRL